MPPPSSPRQGSAAARHHQHRPRRTRHHHLFPHPPVDAASSSRPPAPALGDDVPPSPSSARRLSSSVRRLSTRDSPSNHSHSHDHDRRRRSSTTTTTTTSTTATTARASGAAKPALLAALRSTLSALAAHSVRLYAALSVAQRVALGAALAAAAAAGVLLLLYSHRLFAALGPVAARWRAAGPLAGGAPLWLATAATAFPPLVGYSTCATVAGFVYGFPGGWPLAASATVAGSAAAFAACQRAGGAAAYVRRLAARDTRFVALGQVLRRDGLALLVMVRLCPLPYSLSNGFLATVGGGSLGVGRFALATAFATPKLLVHVFIGSRLALLAESGDEMSGADRAVNYASMVVGGLLGFGVGLVIYRRTMARAAELAREAQLEAGEALLDGGAPEDEATGRRAADGLLDENGPLADPDDLDVAALMGDDDISLWETDGDGGYRDGWDGETGKQGAIPNGHGVGIGNMNGVKR